jgi:hypothetical protein
MSTTNEQSPTSAPEQAPAKKSPAKRAKKADAPGQSASISAGQRLLELKLTGTLGAIARLLASDRPVTRRDLVALRDGINARSVELRDAKQGAQAKKLARANRLVRRLERAARKGR